MLTLEEMAERKNQNTGAQTSLEEMAYGPVRAIAARTTPPRSASPYAVDSFSLPKIDTAGVSRQIAGMVKPSPVPTAALDAATLAQPWERALAVPEEAKPGWQRAFDEAAWNSLLFGAAKPEYVPQGTAEKIASFLGGLYGMVPSLAAGGAVSNAAARMAGPVTKLLNRVLGRTNQMVIQGETRIGAQPISEATVRAALKAGIFWGGRVQRAKQYSPFSPAAVY